MECHKDSLEGDDLQTLRARLEGLEAENWRLSREIEFLRGNPSIAKGMKGESLIAKLLAANHAPRGAGHDLESDSSDLLFEVKYSSLLATVRGRPIRRWAWTKLFGELGRKTYHRLLLVGDADPRYSTSYADPSSPYVIFDVPYDAAVHLAGGIRTGRNSRIHLTTNPLSVRSSGAAMLYREFQVTASELYWRYPALETVQTAEADCLQPIVSDDADLL